MVHLLPAKTIVRRHHAGFSMVEMALVMCIIAIMAVMAVPRYSNSLTRYRADAAARRIAQDLEVAQSRAYSRNTTQSIIFTVSTSSYQIVGMSDPNHPTQSYTVRLADAPYSATLQTASFGGSSTISYDAFGQPTTTGTVVVNVGQEQRTVTISPSSGRATVQ